MKKKVSEIISSEDTWSKYDDARNKEGIRVGYSHPDAFSFSMMSAIALCYDNETERRIIFSQLHRESDTTTNTDFNAWESQQKFKTIQQLIDKLKI